MEAKQPKTNEEHLVLISDHVVTLLMKVGKIEDKLNKMPDDITCNEKHRNIEKRLGGLERWRWYLTGGLIVGIFILKMILSH